MLKTHTKSIYYYFLIFSIYLSVFWSVLQYSVWDFFSYWDETLTIFCGVFILFEETKYKGIIKISQTRAKIYLPVIGYIIAGLISNLICRYANVNVAIMDAFLNIKFVLVVLAYSLLFKKIDIRRYRNNIQQHIKFLSIVLFVIFLFDKYYHVFPVYETRFGIESEQLFFAHPTFAAAAYTSLLILFVTTIYGKLNIKNVPYCIILMLLNVLTLRFKAIGVTILFIIIYLATYYRLFRSIKIICVCLGVLAIAFFAYDQIYFYFLSPNAITMPRGALLQTGLKIIKDHFPFGTGFGTFGSYLSGVNYSKVYSVYHINKVYGMTVDNIEAIADNYWPMVMGQSGMLGCVCQIFLWKGLFDNCAILKIEKNYYMGAIFVMIFLLITSTSESTIVNPIGVAMGIILGIIMSQGSMVDKH